MRCRLILDKPIRPRINKLAHLCGMYRLLILILWMLPVSLVAQIAPKSIRAIVRDIAIEGNDKTRASYITREMILKVGDSIPLSKLASTLEENRLRLMNTNLFNSVQMNVKNWTVDDSLTIAIKVVENWYFYPVPIFELADRNLNVWWNEQNRSLKRTNIGLRLIYANATGRRDPIAGLLQFGYTPKLSLAYNLPYLNKKQTLGMSGGVFYAVNRELGYGTEGDKIAFYRNPENSVIYTRYYANMAMTYQPQLFSLHNIGFGYSKHQIDTSVSQRLNPNYFREGKNEQEYLWLSYNYSHDTRDIRPYPKHGHLLNIDAVKYGFSKKSDINALDVSARLAFYTPLSTKFNLETVVKGKAAVLRQTQPYSQQRALGFGSDFIRGYEYYIVDGYDYAYSKNSLRFEFINREYSFAKILKWDMLKGFRSFPVKCYLTTNFDIGYVNAPQAFYQNKLPNRILYGGGIGLDVVLYYSMVWSFEYSWNHLGERGFFLRYRGI
jgi:hypothetical protein